MLTAHPPGEGTGSARRGAATLEALRALFHRVDVVSLAFADEARFADPAVRLIARPARPGAAKRLAMLARGGAYYWPEHGAGLHDRIGALAAGGELLRAYDLVWCHSMLMARAAQAVGAHARVLDIDNVPSADARTAAAGGPARRAYVGVLSAAFAREERSRAALHDLVTVTSGDERERLGRVRPPVTVLPNTVTEVPPAHVAASGPQALFVGSLGYRPNIDAVRWLAESIVPRLRARVPATAVRVVGRDPGEDLRGWCVQAGVELVADAPSLQPHYHAARVMLAPLRSGGGTRIKVLEALAYGVPVVATPQAVEGLGLTHGVDVQIGAGADEIVAGAAALLEDPAAAARIGEAGRAAWALRHGPAETRRVITAIVCDLIPL